jgi:hypothetical protein
VGRLVPQGSRRFREPGSSCLATFRDWGFPLASIRQVTIWQARTTNSYPHFNSIAGHLPEIISTLIAAGQPAQN